MTTEVIAPAAAPPAAPTPPPPVIIRDTMGVPYDVYAGANRDPALDAPITGDRGDDLAAPTAPVQPAPAAPVEPVPPNPVAPESPVDPAAPPVDPDEPPRDDQGRFIPKARFNEINERMQRAEAVAKALQDQLTSLLTPGTPPADPAAMPPPKAYDFDDAESKYFDLVLDGKKDEALALRREIRAEEQKAVSETARTASTQVSAEQQLQTSIADIASGYESRITALQPEHADFNAELMEDIRSVYSGNLQTGRYKTPAEAWDKSIQAALRMNGIDPNTGAAPPAPAPAPAPAPKPGATAAARVAAIAATPPLVAAAGLPGSTGHDQIDVSKLTADDMAKLPVETQKRLRGDFV